MSGLTQIHLAAEEDKDHEPDKWARLFNALTWEDFKMISADNKNMQEAGETLFTLNGNDRILYLCAARRITELKSSNNQKDSLIASLEARIAALQQQLSESSINSL